MFFLPLVSLFCAALSSAEVICYIDPGLHLPPVVSCTRALHSLRTWVGECGIFPQDFGPAPLDPGVIRLPQYFIDSQNDSPIKCGISVFWAPRPGASLPGSVRVDHICPISILHHAARIMRICAYGPGEGHTRPYPLKLGYAWIWLRQWVLVQFHAIRGNSPELGGGNGSLTVMMDGGANTTVDAGLFNPSTCGSPVRLLNQLGNGTEAAVEA